MSLTIVALVVAEPGQAVALRAAQEALVAATLQEPGCLRYELHESNEDAHTRMFIESWSDEAAWQVHMKAPAMKQFQASSAGLIRSVTLHQMTPIAGR